MSKAPHMPWFIDAYMADTAHLSMEESGCYMHLLASMWRRDGSIPDDDKEIARICRMTKYQWLKIKPHLIPFLIIENGSISQKRLKKEWLFVRNYREKMRQSAISRWNKNKELDNNQASPMHMHSECTHTHTHKERKKVTRASALPGFDKFWETFPNKVGKGMAIKSWAGAIKKTTPEEILAGVERYKSSKPADRAWCNPSTFLNGERWLDQPSEVATTYTPKPVNGFKPTMVLNSYQTFAPAEKFIPPTPEEIARRDAAIKAMRSAVKRA